jgi:hypothetical protein
VRCCCSESSVCGRILGCVATLVLPSWVVPEFDAVRECERVALRLLDHHPYGATTRDSGGASALVWLTLGEVSPIAGRASVGVFDPPDRSGTWTSGVTRELAQAESWVALCVAAAAPLPTAQDWERLGVGPAAAVRDDPEYAYGVWRTLSWLLGVREDFPIYTGWHRAAGLPHDRPRLQNRTLRDPVTPAWHAAERAAQDQARTDARRWWEHVRARADATA